MQFSNREDIKKQVMQEVYAVDPLSDKAFKKFLESDKWFKIIAELVLNRPIPDGCIISIQGEFALTVNGKLIRMDNLRKTPIGIVNMEAQTDANKFSFKRHLFYWALAYVFTLKESQDYSKLEPAFSIVFYKNKGTAGLIESACLDGTLLHTEDDKNQLSLIAVNAAKWNEAQDGELKQTLATLYNGTYKDENAEMFAGVDTNSEYFRELNSAVRIASLKVKYQDAKERGDKNMESIVYEFLTEEQAKALIEEGIEKGKLEMIRNMFKKGASLEFIGEVSELPVKRIKELQKQL